MWADVSSQSADSYAQANEWRPNQLAMKHHAEARELSSSLSISAQTKANIHATHRWRRPSSQAFPSTDQATWQQHKHGGGQAESGRRGVGGEFLARGKWARREAEVEVDPTVSFKAVSMTLELEKPTAQPKIKKLLHIFWCTDGWSRLFTHPHMLPPVIEPTPLPRPSGTEDELENVLSPFFFFRKDKPLPPPRCGVRRGEVRRFWWMKVRVMSRSCGYTSAGAGPVSLGLVVTMLALLLTCRGQCRGDMTNIHFTLVHTHAGYAPVLRNPSRIVSQPTVDIRQDFATTNQSANVLW